MLIWHLPLHLFAWSLTGVYLESVIQGFMSPWWQFLIHSEIGYPKISFVDVHVWPSNDLHRLTYMQKWHSGAPDVGCRKIYTINRKLRYVYHHCLCMHSSPLWVAPVTAVRYYLNGGPPTWLRFIIRNKLLLYIVFLTWYAGPYLYLFGWINSVSRLINTKM